MTNHSECGLPLLFPMRLRMLCIYLHFFVTLCTSKWHTGEITTDPVNQRQHAKEMQTGTHYQ